MWRFASLTSFAVRPVAFRPVALAQHPPQSADSLGNLPTHGIRLFKVRNRPQPR